jgi:hypothetical protein
MDEIIDFKIGDCVKLKRFNVWGQIVDIYFNTFNKSRKSALTVAIDNAGKPDDPFMYSDGNYTLSFNIDSWEKITERERFLLNLKD